MGVKAEGAGAVPEEREEGILSMGAGIGTTFSADEAPAAVGVVLSAALFQRDRDSPTKVPTSHFLPAPIPMPSLPSTPVASHDRPASFSCRSPASEVFLRRPWSALICIPPRPYCGNIYRNDRQTQLSTCQTSEKLFKCRI